MFKELGDSQLSEMFEKQGTLCYLSPICLADTIFGWRVLSPLVLRVKTQLPPPIS